MRAFLALAGLCAVAGLRVAPVTTLTPHRVRSPARSAIVCMAAPGKAARGAEARCKGASIDALRW